MLPMVIVTILFNIFAFVMLIARPKLFGVELFKPMLLNIKLSIIPIFILLGTLLVQMGLLWIAAVTNLTFILVISYILLFIGVVAWFLFLPNAGYLVTELNLTHREMDKKEVPIWYDIISVLSLSFSGVLNMVLNIVIMQYIFIFIYLDPAHFTFAGKAWFWAITSILFIILSFGIYMGRYIRFNSWDLLHLKSFFHKFAEHFSNKENRKAGFLFTLLYGIFFALVYYLTFFGPIHLIIK